MTRLFPHPLLTLALTLMWLMLTRFSLGHLLLGAAVAILAGLAFARLEPQPPRLRAIWPLIRLAAVVSVDILRSNWAVALRMLHDGGARPRRSGFVAIPLRLRDPVGLALLALVVAAIPGTVWIDYDPGTGVLLLHVFELQDAEALRAEICARYETRLLEAFG
ncbi:Na+/H+ antiporter subunit E [Rhodobacter capsulatus]|uniref:Na+/H+ antiporter subunit E n=1 Tax=Rhodobacter capsulatus TaxID=1061 RepID=UPI0006DD06F4|nr:Na+/H+ antiporter subunit E [Rhodobacter capsulatus]KQB13955.1 cation:proton antiporter [Rhodobacter capsulatus]KQB14385.1 cation:proton antiporter [Rhodobacter capsulatus]PZX23338.1 multicomponent K+:H+ antiporter subunit E [Rhodobacter capsulatus]QNR64815.1 Na+/H+ antiporter subunit E [Rhodobacter capsulatus]